MLPVVTLTFLAGLAEASFGGNLNYRSPSHQHPGMGIDIAKVQKRSIPNPYWKGGKTGGGVAPWGGPWGPPPHGYQPAPPRPSQEAPPAGWDATKPSGFAPAGPFDSTGLNFTHGVASGDPWPASVILWTRVAPSLVSDASNITVNGTAAYYNHDTAEYIAASAHPICVEYVVASDAGLKNVVDKGNAYTTSDIDYTIKVEALNLKPFTQYWYQFTVCGSTTKSPLGRTKTTPHPDDHTAKVGLAVFSCSNYPNGYFNAYGNAARKDNVDYFVHLGDYIYETSTGVLGRDARATNPPRTIFTLYDYRTRIAQYRTDLDLLLAHQNFPWITEWDDHEVSNNGYRDGSSALNNTEQSFLRDGGVSVDQRKMNAVRAYFEWMPIRSVDMDDNLRIWRNFQIGSLFDLIMLDTRNYDRSITDLNWNTHYTTELVNDAGRSLMGSHQENWFYRQLSESNDRGAAWRIIGNQIVFSRVNISNWFGSQIDPYNTDQGSAFVWDGYQSNRNRTLQHMYENNIGNNIMLAGDSHANWVSDLVWLDEAEYDPATGVGAIGVEFAGTAVTSSGFGGTINSANIQAGKLVRDNSELLWNEGYYRGYFEMDIGYDAIHTEYFGCPTVATRNPYEISLANFTVYSGANKIARPVAGGRVQNGALQSGLFAPNNITYNTATKAYSNISFPQMFITYPRTI